MQAGLIIAAVVGNILEYFDFLLFAHFSPILTSIFFKDSDEEVKGIITAFFLFSIGFIARPLGGLLFGILADKYGRKKSLANSILWIAVPTFCIGCLPTYAEIGFLATLLLLTCRIIQGISIGGEYANAGIFLMEHARKENRGLYSGILSASGSIGSLVAIACVYLVKNNITAEWGWRLPFLLSAPLGFLAYKIRKYMNETPIYLEYSSKNLESKTNFLKEISLLSFVKKEFITTIILGAFISILIWIPVTYTNYYLSHVLKWPIGQTIGMVIVALLTFIVSSILMGYIADKIGAKKLMGSSAVITIGLAYPLFYLLTDGKIIIAQICFSILAAGCGAAIHAILIELFPAQIRCKMISTGFSLGIAFGSAAPMVSVWLVDISGSQRAPFLYVMLISILAFMTIVRYSSNDTTNPYLFKKSVVS